MLRYFKEAIDFGSEESEVAIVTLWTKKEIVKKHVKNYRYIGQLYSGDVGISNLIRNCLFDKNIRHIVVIGADLSNSGNALVNLFEKGTADGKIIGCSVAVEPEIPVEKIELLRKNVLLHDLRKQPLEKLAGYINNLDPDKYGSYGNSEEFPIHETALQDTFPSESSGFHIKDEHVSNAWLKILKLVTRFGTLKPSSYHEKQKEILNLVTVITKEDPDIPKLTGYLRFTKEELMQYYEQIITSKKVENIEYTYGIRLMDYEHIDQVQNIIRMLKDDRNSRRAIAITWDVECDSVGTQPPCLILVQSIIQDERLFLTCYFRSNDMFLAWPKNAFALRKLQSVIAEGLDIMPGHLTIISGSAHIYERNFDDARKILEASKPIKRFYDSRGNLIIYIKDNQIHVQHQSCDGHILNEYYAKNAPELFLRLIDDNVISEVSHALDIGAELQKAEMALEWNVEYMQDNKLKI